MEELTREEAIRRHRLMWNWLADEAEKGKVVVKKDAFKHFGWNTSEALSKCWCCEWVYIEWQRSKHSFAPCAHCILDWSNGENEVCKATCTEIITCDDDTKPGLYKEWYFATRQEVNLSEASKFARIIANLPEKKEVQDDD